MCRRGLWISSVVVLVWTLILSVITASVPVRAQAADASSFDAGLMITDDLFYDSNAMEASGVQGFLEQKVRNCRTDLSTSADPIICLKNYTTRTVAKASESGLCNGYSGGQTQTAAQIIGGVARSCGISQKVLLVMLEKEQGLVTNTYPSEWRYRTAMGMGCPDTAACDAQYFGFFNQVYGAARQLKLYAKYPTSYAYRAGRVNRILYHPNASCGARDVYIQNQATASLYIYTPYTPNAAALNAGYGTGNSCSSYGNRNFVFLYTDWFGSTKKVVALAKTSSSPDVYLLSDAGGTRTKYLVTSFPILQNLAPLGQVATVSAAMLSVLPTGAPMKDSTLLDSTSGDVFLARGKTLNRFTSCAQMAAVGLECRGVPMSGSAIRQVYAVGADFGPFVQGDTSVVYYLLNGQRHAIDTYGDFTALATDAGASGIVRLDDARIRSIGEGYAYIRPGIGISSGGRVAVAADGGGKVNMGSAVLGRAWSSTGELRATTTKAFDSLEDVGSVSTFQVACPSGSFVALGNGVAWAVAGNSTGLETSSVSASGCSAFSSSGQSQNALLVKETGSASVFLLTSGRFQPFQSWTALVQRFGSAVSISSVSREVLTTVGIGPSLLEQGSVVRVASRPELYFVASTSSRAYVPAMGLLGDLGLNGMSAHSFSDASELDSAPVTAQALGNVLSCDGVVLVFGSGSALRVVDSSTLGVNPVQVSRSACASLPGATGTTQRVFMKVADSPVLYLLESGRLRPLSSWSAFLTAGSGRSSWVTVSAQTLALYPMGSAL